MEKTVFRVRERIERPFMWIIKADAMDPHRTLILYLDKEHNEPIYPITVEGGTFDPVITITADNKASCGFPPSIPESQVDIFMEYMKLFHGTLSAARELVASEQERIKKGES